MSISARDLIDSIYNPEDIVCFRVFDDKKRGTFPGAKLSCEAGKYSQVETQLKTHNEQGRGIFFVVNTGGHTDDSITRINAQFVEMDDKSFEEQQALIDAFDLPPSIVIKTRKSLHCYWLMKDAEVDLFRSIQKGLIKYFSGDPACVNESRVLRLPGFFHCKEDPMEVTCISFHPERRYTQGELAAVLPMAEEERSSEHLKGSQAGLEIVCAGCDFIKHCQEHAGTLSEHDWYAMITNLAVFEGGETKIHELSHPYPGYDKAATDRKIQHFLSSGTRPIKCTTIAEKGFACEKLRDGSCKCKSPAAICFEPLSIDAVSALLDAEPVTGKALEDIQRATAFVSRYLFNMDQAMASAVINHMLKDHFKLRNADLKPIEKEYRDQHKAHKKRKEEAADQEEKDELPAWYEPSPSGLKFLPGILAEDMAKTENVFYSAQEHRGYAGGVYMKISEMEAQRMIQKKMLTRHSRMSQIVDAEKQWRLLIQKDPRDINPNPFIINVKNGLYNVLEDELMEHRPEYFSTIQLNVSHDPAADCPLFKKFLAESMGGDMEQVKLIQEMLGYLLIPVNSAQKCFVIVGVANSGKSLLLRVISELLLGKENVSNVSWQALNERFKTAELFGKLANIFADLPTKNIDDNGIFKALVGEDYLTVERKNKDPFSFQSTARLLFSCNSIPKNYGDKSEGFYRRLIIIRFAHPVPIEKRDTSLIDKFRMEADGIFQFALEGLRRLLDNHYVFSETQVNRDELQRYREESDSVLSFVKEGCVIKEDARCGSTELFRAYKEYCEESGLKPYSQKSFVQQITSCVPSVTRDIDRVAKRRILCGIGLSEVLG